MYIFTYDLSACKSTAALSDVECAKKDSNKKFKVVSEGEPVNKLLMTALRSVLCFFSTFRALVNAQLCNNLDFGAEKYPENCQNELLNVIIKK